MPDDSRLAMLEVNDRQRDFYESRHEAKQADLGASERAANRVTRAWTRLRRTVLRLRSAAGVEEYLLDLHRRWLGDLSDKRVLDLGCFDGNALSVWLADSAAAYTGIDLSSSAVAVLQRKLDGAGVVGARAQAIDFLDNPWPDGSFDVVYAYSVLHHFSDLEVALAEVRRILAPDGIVVSVDPLAIEPFNRLARAVYRPFQSDRAWEFPLDEAALRTFRRHFRVEEQRGIGATVKLAYPLLAIPGLASIGRRLARPLIEFDDRHTRGRSMTLYQAWHITMKLRPRPVGRAAYP
jgi:SAM-dependent methyltransferase